MTATPAPSRRPFRSGGKQSVHTPGAESEPRSSVVASIPSGARATRIDAGRCRRGCEGNLVTVVMHIRGEAVTMTSCSTCDHRSWARAGQPVDLRSLLEEIKAALPLRKAS